MQNIEKEFENFSPEELELVKNILNKNPITMLKKIEEDLYRVKPPTPREFLRDWIHPGLNLHPFVIEDFCELWDPDNDYHEAVLYGGTRIGKTMASRLSVIYCVVRLWCLKSPHEYFNLSIVSALAIYLMGFSLQKARQVLLYNIIQILDTSPKFHKVMFTDKVRPTQKTLGDSKIVWCTASIVGEISFAGEIHICIGANPMDIIGADIVMAVITEINFFVETAGVTEEDVWKVYTSTKDRIKGTVGNKYGSMIILDSSARDRDSIIEEYITSVAAKDPRIFFRQYNRWETMPWLFPSWQKTKKMFTVFLGDTIRRPCIVDEKFRMAKGDERKLIQVPIDAYDAFKENIHQALQNIAGQPTSLENLFFPDLDFVKAQLFDDYLPNVSRPVEAPLSSKSDSLILNQIQPIFMQKDISGKWELRRAQHAPRWVRVDLSDTSDSTGVAMCHPEVRDDGSILCVYDFIFDIRPTKEGINLDAVKEFIHELYTKCGISVVGISSDRYQSKFIEQAVKKDGRDYKLISVDTDKTPYIIFKSKVLNGNCKVGYYENLYNNLKSLTETKDKIDHTVVRRGSEKYNNIGLNAKDLCLSGDTKISLTSGVDEKISNLCGKTVEVFSCLPSGEITIGVATNIRKTGFREDMLRVTLDNNETINCTTNHPFMMRDGSYKPAIDLRPGDSLMPLYKERTTADSRHGLNGYWRLKCNYAKKWRLIHELVARVILRFDRRSYDIKMVIHHKDFNKENNDSSNLAIMTWDEHRDYHNKVGRNNFRELWKKESFREIMRKSRVYTDERRKLISKMTAGKNNPRYRHGVKDETIKQMVEKGIKLKDIACILKMSTSSIQRRYRLMHPNAKCKIRDIYNDKRCYFDFNKVINHVRQQAYLVKGMKITVIDAREYTGKIDFDKIYYLADSDVEATSRTFYFEGGLRSLVAFYNQIQKPVHSNIFYIEKESDNVGVEVSLQYVDDISSRIMAFANNIYKLF
jgi:hypothetical protein